MLGNFLVKLVKSPSLAPSYAPSLWVYSQQGFEIMMQMAINVIERVSHSDWPGGNLNDLSHEQESAGKTVFILFIYGLDHSQIRVMFLCSTCIPRLSSSSFSRLLPISTICLPKRESIELDTTLFQSLSGDTCYKERSFPKLEPRPLSRFGAVKMDKSETWWEGKWVLRSGERVSSLLLPSFPSLLYSWGMEIEITSIWHARQLSQNFSVAFFPRGMHSRIFF